MDNKDYVNITFHNCDMQELKAYDEGLRFVFPEWMHRVNAAEGGESYLIVGSEKTALWDCGMCYQGEGLVRNIRAVLGERPLDYVLLSHTHYDHLGALPYVRKAYPCVITFGAAYGQKVLTRPSALEVMERLGNAAAASADDKEKSPIITEGLVIDRAVGDGDVIDLGDRKIRVLTTPGHTDCSLSFAIEPERLLLTSESTGVYHGDDMVDPAILKSFDDAMISLAKCRAYGANQLASCHFGLLPPGYTERYFDRFEYFARRERYMIKQWLRDGRTPDEVLDLMVEAYREQSQGQQVEDAFVENACWTIRMYRKEVEKEENDQ